MSQSPNKNSNKNKNANIQAGRLNKQHIINNITLNATNPSSSRDNIDDSSNGEWTHMPSKRHLSDSSDSLSPDPTINKNKKLFITKNRYEPLQAESQITQNSTTDTQKSISETPNYVNPIKPPPPIFVKGIVNFPDLCAALIEKIGVDNFFCKSSTYSLKIQTANPDAYRTLVHFLRDQNAQFHTYQLREDKPTRVVLRNLHSSTSTELIKSELELRLFEVRKVTNVLHKTSKSPLPLFFVNLEPTVHSNDIFKLSSFLHTKIKVEEPYKPKVISQCLNCQDLIKSNHPDGTAHGGAVILIKSNLQYYSLVNYSQNHFQSCAISITINNIPVAIAAIYSPPRHNLTVDNLTDFFDSTANNFIIGGDYNTKHQSWGYRVTNPRGNLLYNFSNMKKYKILAPPGPTYWPTSVRKKPDILDIFVTKIPSNLYYSINNIDATPQIRTVSPKLFTATTDRLKFHNIIAEEINLKISLKSAHEIDDAVNNLTTLIQSAASKSNPQNTTNNSNRAYGVKPKNYFNTKAPQSHSKNQIIFKAHLHETFQPHHDILTPENIDEVNTYLNLPSTLNQPEKYFTPNEVKQTIQKYSLKKSPGFDLIMAEVAKCLPKKAIVLITYIFNASLRLSYFPMLWKFSKIVLFSKLDKPLDTPTSFRPISLLPFFSKVLERLILKRLMPHIITNNIFPNTQFGFRNSHSTIHQLHRVVDVISTSLEKKLYCSCIFLDVAQAFDRVWHEGLQYKLKKCLPSPLYLLIKSYLTDRHFQVQLNSSTSEIAPIKAGVPQGGILSPFLFNIYVADQPTMQQTIVADYTDDKVILSINEDPLIASSNLQIDHNHNKDDKRKSNRQRVCNRLKRKAVDDPLEKPTFNKAKFKAEQEGMCQGRNSKGRQI
ncbi:hypothetical protein QTP88_025561 [Uroleucon formosanum]